LNSDEVTDVPVVKPNNAPFGPRLVPIVTPNSLPPMRKNDSPYRRWIADAAMVYQNAYQDAMGDKLARAMAQCAILDREDEIRRVGFHKVDYQTSHSVAGNACYKYAVLMARRAERMWRALNPAPPPPPEINQSEPCSPTPLTPRERAEAAGWRIHDDGVGPR